MEDEYLVKNTEPAKSHSIYDISFSDLKREAWELLLLMGPAAV